MPNLMPLPLCAMKITFCCTDNKPEPWLQGLAAARDAELVTVDQHDTLLAAWLMATRVRNIQMLVAGKSQDQVSTDLLDLRLMADVVGVAGGAELLEDYRRTTRRARAVFEECFYGSVTTSSEIG